MKRTSFVLSPYSTLSHSVWKCWMKRILLLSLSHCSHFANTPIRLYRHIRRRFAKAFDEDRNEVCSWSLSLWHVLLLFTIAASLVRRGKQINSSHSRLTSPLRFLLSTHTMFTSTSSLFCRLQRSWNGSVILNPTPAPDMLLLLLTTLPLAPCSTVNTSFGEMEGFEHITEQGMTWNMIYAFKKTFLLLQEFQPTSSSAFATAKHPLATVDSRYLTRVSPENSI